MKHTENFLGRQLHVGREGGAFQTRNSLGKVLKLQTTRSVENNSERVGVIEQEQPGEGGGPWRTLGNRRE